MQGVYIQGRRPKSKKEVREAVAQGTSVQLEATSLFGNEYSGPVADAPAGKYFIVGPDPYTSRKFYGQIIKNRDGKVTVK